MPKSKSKPKSQCMEFPSKEEEAKTLVRSGFSYNQVIQYSGIPFESLSKIVNAQEGHYLLNDTQIECYETNIGKRRGLIKKLTHGMADKQRNQQLKEWEDKKSEREDEIKRLKKLQKLLEKSLN